MAAKRMNANIAASHPGAGRVAGSIAQDRVAPVHPRPLPAPLSCSDAQNEDGQSRPTRDGPRQNAELFINRSTRPKGGAQAGLQLGCGSSRHGSSLLLRRFHSPAPPRAFLLRPGMSLQQSTTKSCLQLLEAGPDRDPIARGSQPLRLFSPECHSQISRPRYAQQSQNAERATRLAAGRPRRFHAAMHPAHPSSDHPSPE